jgi:hypothetical protein
MSYTLILDIYVYIMTLLYPRSPKGERGILFYLCSSVRPSVLTSVQDIFCRIFLSNCWWQKSDIWSQASYSYTILWVAFLDPSDSYFLFAVLVGFLYTLNKIICTFFVTFFSATIDGRNLIFGHKLHIGTPYRGKRSLTRQIPTSCLLKSGGIISEH